jgi:hypothetical protein
MRKVFWLLLPVIIACCNEKSDRVVILVENNSDIDPVVYLRTYIDGKFIKTIEVKRDTSKVQFERLLIEHAFRQNNTITLGFTIERSNDTTSCVVSREQLTDKSFVL